MNVTGWGAWHVGGQADQSLCVSLYVQVVKAFVNVTGVGGGGAWHVGGQADQCHYVQVVKAFMNVTEVGRTGEAMSEDKLTSLCVCHCVSRWSMPS